MKSHLSTFEPQLDELKTKYDGAMREKMVYKLEKEKLQNELNTLKLGNVNSSSGNVFEKESLKSKILLFLASADGGLGPTQAKLREFRLKEEKKKVATTNEQRRLTGSTELINEAHPKVRFFSLKIFYSISMLFRIRNFQLIQEIIPI